MKARWGGVGVIATLSGLACGCAALDRSLIFVTSTTYGLSVTPVGTGTSGPKVVLAYQREEGVMNPVYDSDGIEGDYVEEIPKDGAQPQVVNKNIRKKYRDEAYSVLAKFEGRSGAANSNSALAQWFATGRAADLLAANPLSMASVTGVPAIAEAVARGKGLAPGGYVRNHSILGAALSSLSAAAAAGDAKAQSYVSMLNGLDSPARTKDFTAYSWDSGAKPPVLLGWSATARPINQTGLARVLAYWQTLYLSVDSLDVASRQQTDPVPLALDGKPAAAITKAEIGSALEVQRAKLINFESWLSTQPFLMDAAIHAVQLHFVQ